MVLVEEGGRRAGLCVDAVAGVRAAELTAEPRGARRAGGLPAAGVARLTWEAAPHGGVEGEGVVPLLDVGAVLDELLDGDAPQ